MSPLENPGRSSKRSKKEPGHPAKRPKKELADKEYEKIAYGSVNDPTPRILLDVKHLDLEWSYVGGQRGRPLGGQGPVPEKPTRKRWQHNGPEPLTDYALLPADWSAYDDDLDEEYVLPYFGLSGSKTIY